MNSDVNVIHKVNWFSMSSFIYLMLEFLIYGLKHITNNEVIYVFSSYFDKILIIISFVLAIFGLLVKYKHKDIVYRHTWISYVVIGISIFRIVHFIRLCIYYKHVIEPYMISM